MSKINKKFLVLIHRVYNNNTVKKGSPDYIISYFRDCGLSYVSIEHPLKSSDSITRILVNGSPSKKISVSLPAPLRWVLETMFNVYYVLITKNKYEFILAIDPLNFVSAYFIKLFGRTNLIYFQSIDYSEHRFKNKLLDCIYGILYKFSINNADVITYSNDVMLNIIKGILGNKLSSKILFHLPHSPEYSKITRINPDKKDKYSIVFTKTYPQDSEIVRLIKIAKILKDTIPDICFHIVGDVTQKSKDLINASKLTNNFKLYGLLGYEDNMKIISKGYIGFSWYENINDHEKFGDSLKIREYAASGIVTVTNNKVPTCQEMYDNGAGVLVDKEKDIAKAIITLIKNEKLYSDYRNNALKWAKAMDKKKLLDNLYEYLVARG